MTPRDPGRYDDLRLPDPLPVPRIEMVEPETLDLDLAPVSIELSAFDGQDTQPPRTWRIALNAFEISIVEPISPRDDRAKVTVRDAAPGREPRVFRVLETVDEVLSIMRGVGALHITT